MSGSLSSGIGLALSVALLASIACGSHPPAAVGGGDASLARDVSSPDAVRGDCYAAADAGFFCTDFCGSDMVQPPDCVAGEWQCTLGLQTRSDQCPAGTCWGAPNNSGCCESDGAPRGLDCIDAGWACGGVVCCSVSEGGCRLDPDASAPGSACSTEGAAVCVGSHLWTCLEGLVRDVDCSSQGTHHCGQGPDGQFACL
jgi:hypothetical protein